MNGRALAKGLAFFFSLAEQTIADVAVTVEPFRKHSRGRLTFIGPIQSLIIGETSL